MPRDVPEASAEIESIHSFAAGKTPGTINIVDIKSKKMSVASIEEIQYAQNRVRFLCGSLYSCITTLLSMCISTSPFGLPFACKKSPLSYA
jgi:hypothetical protein